MEGTKPLKRSAAIVEFSKDHHFALLLVWKIREGLKKSIEPSRISGYAIHFYDTDLVYHFKEEEDLLFNKLSSDNLQRLQAESDHKKIKQLIDELRERQEDKSLLEVFADTLEKHIRFEERELFNYLQQHISEKDLAEIASSIKPRAHETDALWEDLFWEVKK